MTIRSWDLARAPSEYKNLFSDLRAAGFIATVEPSMPGELDLAAKSVLRQHFRLRVLEEVICPDGSLVLLFSR